MVIHRQGYQSTRHTVKSSQGQLVTQSTRHSQLVTMLNYADGQLVTRSTHHTVVSSHSQLVTRAIVMQLVRRRAPSVDINHVNDNKQLSRHMRRHIALFAGAREPWRERAIAPPT